MSTPLKRVILPFFMMMQDAVWPVLEFGAFLDLKVKCDESLVYLNLITRNTDLSKLTFQRQVVRSNGSLNPHFGRKIPAL